MARKNLLSGLIEAKLPAGNFGPEPVSGATQAAASVSVLVSQGAIGAVSRSIEQLKQQVSDAQRVQEQLAGGLSVVELDPRLIDSSFVADRLLVPENVQAELRESMREHGQQVPILVRPHPGAAGRFQVAYGHRRLKAAAELGRQVRAVVRDLTNEQLVVAQGLENSARANLTFIERALFALRLEEEGFSRETIMSALTIDKTALSKLIAVPSRIPRALVLAIGAAPATGRDRWLQLVELVKTQRAADHAVSQIGHPDFTAADSDKRFELICEALTPDRPKSRRPKPQIWKDQNGVKVGRIIEDPKEFILALNRKSVPGFSEFLKAELPKLLKHFRNAGS